MQYLLEACVKFEINIFMALKSRQVLQTYYDFTCLPTSLHICIGIHLFWKPFQASPPTISMPQKAFSSLTSNKQVVCLYLNKYTYFIHVYNVLCLSRYAFSKTNHDKIEVTKLYVYLSISFIFYCFIVESYDFVGNLEEINIYSRDQLIKIWR